MSQGNSREKKRFSHPSTRKHGQLSSRLCVCVCWLVGCLCVCVLVGWLVAWLLGWLGLCVCVCGCVCVCVCVCLFVTRPGFNLAAVDISGMRDLLSKLQPAALGAVRFYVHGGNFTP